MEISPGDVSGPGLLGPHDGVVRSFDVPAGLGVVEDADGNAWMFHCTQIADGSRAIDPGASVRFEVRAGGIGRFEAFAVAAVA